jgi:DNA (cytosine-5)-methyltransferase 1
MTPTKQAITNASKMRARSVRGGNIYTYKMITHIDLFSGIGGFALALDQVYGKETKHIFVENDKFCQAVLKKHWPEAEYHDDVRTFAYARSTKSRGLSSKQRKKDKKIGSCDYLTGGFPCQPFSQAGVRKGTSDDRYLWPEMFRIIREARPKWVIAENVRGLLTIQDGLVFEQVCADLEGIGYEVRAFVIPAVAVGAPHRRDRVWIIAHATSQRRNDREYNREERQILHNQNRDAEKNKPERSGWGCGIGEVGADVTNTRQQLRSKGSSEGLESDTSERTTRTIPDKRGSFPDWERDWKEVAFTTCYDGVDDGLQKQMDGVAISSARHRKERLKACGNAIVPQVAIKIIQAIKNTDEKHFLGSL